MTECLIKCSYNNGITNVFIYCNSFVRVFTNLEPTVSKNDKRNLYFWRSCCFLSFKPSLIKDWFHIFSSDEQ